MRSAPSPCRRAGLALLLGLALIPLSDAGGADEDVVEDLLEEIAGSEERLGRTDLSPRLRSIALDEAIETRTRLIELEPLDPRRASWHADLAEDLLLRRIEFPEGWTRHLLNADPACPLMPAEIPVIVARGLSAAAAATRLAGEDLRTMETDDAAGSDVELMNRIERLRFERDVRGPLLEAIGLVLASRVDPGAAARAYRTLSELEAAHADSETIRPVVRRWRLLAAIESGDLDELVRSDDRDLAELESDLDRIRATMSLVSPRAAASLAARRHQMLADDDRYGRLLVADLRERAVATELATGGTPARRTPERGDLWIRMLEDPVGRVDWSFDGALVPRLATLADTEGAEPLPLAVHWALAEEELSRRSAGDPADDLAGRRLASRLETADPLDPAHARALSALGRLAISEGDRAAAARALERLYLQHPDAPTANPGLVADLLGPLLGLAEEPWMAGSYERALRASAAGEEADPAAAEARNLRLAALADHLEATGRGLDALSILESIETDAPSTAATILERRARIVHDLHLEGLLAGESARSRHRGIAAAHRALFTRYGETSPDLNRSRAVTFLQAVRSRRTMDRIDPNDLETVERIAVDAVLEPEVRIRAHLERHQLRMRSLSGREDALENAPDLIAALRIDDELATRMLLETGVVILEEIDAARRTGGHLEATRIGVNRLRPIAVALDAGAPPSSGILDRVATARILTEGRLLERALAAWDNLAEEHPGTLEILVGRSDALFRSKSEDDLGEAMLVYRRLAQGDPGEVVPADVWWRAQLRQLLILEQVGRSLDRIGPRIERLRLVDPGLGGPEFREAFETLSARLRTGRD